MTPLPPPPPLGDLAQIIHNQTLILETLANALLNKRPREQTMNDKLTAFLRTKPPTFAGSSNPWMQTTGCGLSKGSSSRSNVKIETKFSWQLTNFVELP